MNIQKLNAKFTLDLESIELDWKTRADPGCLFTEGGAKDVRTNVTSAKRIVLLTAGVVARRKRCAHERNKREAHSSLWLGFVARHKRCAHERNKREAHSYLRLGFVAWRKRCAHERNKHACNYSITLPAGKTVQR